MRGEGGEKKGVQIVELAGEETYVKICGGGHMIEQRCDSVQDEHRYRGKELLNMLKSTKS